MSVLLIYFHFFKQNILSICLYCTMNAISYFLLSYSLCFFILFLVKLTAVDNRGSTVSRRAKFVIFFYRAANAPSMAKAKAGRHMGAIEQAFHGYHCMFQVDELHELSESEVVKKLRSSGGAHQVIVPHQLVLCLFC